MTDAAIKTNRRHIDCSVGIPAIISASHLRVIRWRGGWETFLSVLVVVADSQLSAGSSVLHPDTCVWIPFVSAVFWNTCLFLSLFFFFFLFSFSFLVFFFFFFLELRSCVKVEVAVLGSRP